MNWVDLALLAAILVSGLIGWVRGLLREALGLGAWALAAWAAWVWYPSLVPFGTSLIPNPDIARPAAFAVIFIVGLIVFSTIASVLSRSVQNSPLATLDGTLGLAFGLARGAVLAALVYIGAALLLPTDRWPPPVLQARLVPYIHETAVWLAALVPQAYRPAVPPPGTVATAAPLPAPLPVQAAATALASGQASRSAQ